MGLVKRFERIGGGSIVRRFEGLGGGSIIKRFEGFNTAFDTQPHPPGEEPLNTPSLQSAGTIIKTFSNPIPTNPIIDLTDSCMKRSR